MASGLEVITFDPQLSQFNRACPRSCSYELSDPTLDSVVVAFDDYTGAAQFASEALELDNVQFTYSVQCASTLSTLPEGETTPQTVPVTLLDRCRLSNIQMPFFTSSYDPRYLWEKTYVPFALGTNNLGCGPIVYELVGLPAPQFAIADRGNEGFLEICTEATNLD